MPIDINSLRADRGGDPDAVRAAQHKRFKDDADQLVDKVLALDRRWREQITCMRELQTKLHKFQREVIAPLKKNKQPCDAELAQAEQLRADIKDIESDHVLVEQERHETLCKLGNAVDEAVPFSNNEDEDNLITSVWPLPDHLQLPCAIAKIQYSLPPTQPLTHDELLWRIGGYDPERGSKVAGNRGYFLQDTGVLLNQALINFAITFLRDRGYKAVQPPFFMKKELMAGIAQLSDFDEQLYKVTTGNNNPEDLAEKDKYLIATSEQPLCALHAKEVLDERELPLRYAGVSTCFRKEVGKANKDNRGIFRVHQFEKVEQFCITAGDLSQSKQMHLEMLQCAEEFHKALGIAFRVVNIVSGELNDAAMIKFDLEGWFPGQGQYRELVSCSNCTDFQSRALDVRCRAHEVDDKNSTVRLSHVHMLNSTLTATGRGICCILETYQTPEGVCVPEVLVPFMGGTRFLPFVRGPRELDGHGVSGTEVKKEQQPKAAKAKEMPKQPTLAKDVKGELQALEEKLLHQPYVGGFTATKADATTLNELRWENIQSQEYPNLARWLENVTSFTAHERAAWA
eukprot:TRINITY_DN61676_c0_g1_i1.p1 TRINITY_DN61676_c0_g1~~TRINITY_DN61676_c0_g1_i1.p1  ORF type:complete len:571 (-),score=126.58 TRINITY_DN61676_c0_g1_i1:186-1898(-)